MSTVKTALELLQPGETGLCLHTDGLHFHFEENGPGSTGNWVVNPARQIDHVIIVRWGPSGDRRFKQLFTARPDEFVRLKDSRRYQIKLIDVRSAGSTDRSWMEFAETGRNPVKYVSRPAAGQMPDGFRRTRDFLRTR